MRAMSAVRFRGADGEIAGNGFGMRARISASLRRANMARPLDVANAGARTPGGVTTCSGLDPGTTRSTTCSAPSSTEMQPAKFEHQQAWPITAGQDVLLEQPAFLELT